VVAKVGLQPIDRIASNKHIEYRKGHAPVEVAEGRRDEFCLTDAELIALAGLGKRLEKLNGCPQDIEFAVDERSA
jgi:pyruvate, water dikinase